MKLGNQHLMLKRHLNNDGDPLFVVFGSSTKKNSGPAHVDLQ